MHATVPSRFLVSADRYTQAAFQQREHDGLWPHVWLVVGRSAAISRPGQQLSTVVGRRTLTVQRTDSGLEGTCRGTPLTVDEALGFVWAHLGEPDGSVRDWLGDVAPALDAYDLESWGQSSSLTVDLGANWKTVADAWNETYHAQGIHRQILGMIDDVNVGFADYGVHGMLVVPFAAPSPRLNSPELGPILQHSLRVAGLDPRRFDGGPRDVRPAIHDHLDGQPPYQDLQPAQLTDCFNYYVFPNHHFVMWRDHMVFYRYRPHPSRVDRCWVDLLSLQRGAPESAIHVDAHEDDADLEEVLAQDIAAIRATQRGMLSAGLTQMVLGGSEVRIARMHEALDALLDQTAPS